MTASTIISSQRHRQSKPPTRDKTPYPGEQLPEVAEAVAKGDAEIGIGVASDAAIVPGLDAVLLPSGAQSYSVYVAGISSRSKQVDAAKALIAFLTSAEIKQALTTRGFEAR